MKDLMRCFVLYLLMGQLWEGIYVVFARIDWLWTGYGEAMGSYVCINLTYRLAMG